MASYWKPEFGLRQADLAEVVMVEQTMTKDGRTIKFDKYKARMQDGKEYWLQRVSNVIAQMDKSEMLIPWAVNVTLEQIRQDIKPDEAYSQIRLEQILQFAKDARWRTQQDAAEVGTRAHAIIEHWIKNNGSFGCDIDAEDERVQNSVILFLEWWQTRKLEPLWSERYVCDVELGVGGTLDLVAIDDDGMVELIDFKTGKGIYDSHAAQVLGGYACMMGKMGKYGQLVHPTHGSIGFPQRVTILQIGKHDASFQADTIYDALADAEAKAAGDVLNPADYYKMFAGLAHTMRCRSQWSDRSKRLWKRAQGV